MAVFANTLGGIPHFLTRTAQASSHSLGSGNKTLVCIFQRGAMDGVQAVQPLEDKHLRVFRPDLFVSAAKSTSDSPLIELDGHFGLNPNLQDLGPLYKDGRLAIVHGIGSPVPTRSHFDAQDYMETGIPGNKAAPSGWLNRATGLLGHEGTPFQAVSLTPVTPRALYGPAYSLSVEHLETLKVGVGNEETTENQGFEALYRQTTQELINNAGNISLDATKLLEEARINAIKPRPGVNYPNSTLGFSLKQIAQLIKGGVGLEIAFAESPGWDTHARQNALFGGFTRQANDLSKSITAFWKDIEPYQQEVVVMTMTEFGRTIHQNGSLGTDHGRASCMFVLGHDVAGGKVYGKVPELAPENLEDGRDLPVTTDFRSLFYAVARDHLGIQEHQLLFPGWESKEKLSVFQG